MIFLRNQYRSNHINYIIKKSHEQFILDFMFTWWFYIKRYYCFFIAVKVELCHRDSGA